MQFKHPPTKARATCRVMTGTILVCCGIAWGCDEDDQPGAGQQNVAGADADATQQGKTTDSENDGAKDAKQDKAEEEQDKDTDQSDRAESANSEESAVTATTAKKGKGKTTANEAGDDEPDADEPDADEPDTDEPDTDEPDTDEPDTDEPDADEPDADEPDTDESTLCTLNSDEERPYDYSRGIIDEYSFELSMDCQVGGHVMPLVMEDPETLAAILTFNDELTNWYRAAVLDCSGATSTWPATRFGLLPTNDLGLSQADVDAAIAVLMRVIDRHDSLDDAFSAEQKAGLQARLEEIGAGVVVSELDDLTLPLDMPECAP